MLSGPRRDFDPGLYKQEEVNLNFDVSYAASDTLNIAAGTEWRDERFTIGAGGRPSWEVGPYAAQGFVSGSNGFPGFSDYTAGAWNRSNVALYGDLELRGRDDRWSFGGALRLEHFDLFGPTTNGKISARYALNPFVALRGGVSTGFRASTPGQQHTLNVQTTIDPETLQLVDSANVPSTFLAATLRGGVPLERGVPRTRWSIALNQQIARVRLLGRLSYYGSWVDHFDARFVRGPDSPLLNGRSIVDLDLGIPLGESVTLSVGGQNIADTFSDRMDLFADIFGLPYSQFTPWGFSGGYYYARLNYGWGG